MNEEALRKIVEDRVGDRLLVVASNREPYMHIKSEAGIKCLRPASGMAIALDSIMQTCGGVWVAHGSGNADKEVVDDNDRVSVPVGEDKYALKRVWMSKKEEEGYYDITSNEMFWPLCHTVYVRPTFNEKAWRQYVDINKRFVDAILSEIKGENAFVWFQDFHLSLAPKMLKEKNDDIVTAHFWHIPWPQYETLRACPWKRDVLEGLLANDLIGFHTRYHCNNFLECVDRVLVSRTDWAEYSILFKGNKTYVKPFPIGVDFSRISRMAQNPEREKEIKLLKKRHNIGDKIVGLGVERIDYTKGIPEKLKALDWFLKKNPEYHGRFVFIQLGAPSRIRVGAYRQINEQITELVEDINWEYGTDEWIPIIYLPRHHDFENIVSYYKMADFCIVSSLHDGMNLVAKEYLAAKNDMDGMLILSQFTGAANELKGAVLVNPYDTRRFASAIKRVFKMSSSQKKEKMRGLRAEVEDNNIYKWAGDIISNISR